MEHLYDEEDDHLSLRKSSNPYDKLLRKLRKSLIASFNAHSKQSKNYKANIILSICLAFISMMQGVALVLRRHDDIAEYPALEKVFAVINYTRLDTLAFDLGVINEFFYAMMVIVYTPVVILVANVMLNMYWKRKPNWLSVKIMAFVLNLLEQILLLPALVLMITVIKYSYLSHELSMFEYADSLDIINSHGLSAASFITVPILVLLLYMNSYFFYDNIYAKRLKLVYSMRDSFVHRVHILARFGMVLCYCFLSSLSKVWYRIGILLLCGIMYLLYTNRLSYFNTILNVENASKKAIIVWSVVAYFVGWGSDSASAIVIMLVFVSPVLIALIYFYTVEQTRLSGRIRNREITSEFQVELKLRSYYSDLEHSKKEDQDAIHHSIEQLFNFATQNFTKCPLLPLWEALYYYHYRRDTFLALLKLSKGHVSEPTLESQFFSNKTETKFLGIENSPERMYLRYLKLLDEAKRSDESCCLQLLAVCTELLSRKIDSQKFSGCVERLSLEMKKTTDKYFRILELYNDNEEVLQLLGSFTYDIMKEAEGKTFISRASMLKNNDLRRGTTSTGLASSSLFNDINGLIVLSCCLQSQGEIILSNSKAYELFKCSKIDLLHKSLLLFLPEEYRKIFPQTLNQLVLFGLHLDSIQHLFRLLLDAEGFLISTNVTMKLTTWDNKPHIMLMMTPNETAERVLIDRVFKIRAHTKLEVPGREFNTMYIGCNLDDVFPEIVARLSAGEKEFMFRSGTDARFVTAEHIEFREVFFTLISFQHLFLSHHSTAPSVAGTRRKDSLKESRKGVRFNAEDAHVQMSDTKHETPLLSGHEANTTVMYSEAEARMKKKYEITTSLTTSSSTSVSFEIQEGLKSSRSLKRVKLLLVFSFLMLVTGLVASIIFVTNILESLKSITTIRDYSERNLEIVAMAYGARSLILSDSELFPYDQQSVISRLQGTTNNLNKLIDFMKSLVGKGSREADAYLTEHRIPMWLKLENSYQFRKMTMLDALYSFTTASTQLSSSNPPFTPMSDSYYVFRNGISDLLQLANVTLHMRVKSEQMSREDNLKVIEYLIYMCGMLIVLPLVFFVAPQFVIFEKQSRKIWLDIYGLSREMILDMRTTATERLQNYFSNEVIIENPAAAKSLDRSTSPTKLWPGFLLRVCFYLLANLVFFIVLEVAFFIPLNELALTIPNYLFWMGLRPKYVTESMLWSRENQLLGHEFTFTLIVPEGELWWYPQERIANATDSIAFVRKVITFGDAKYGVTSVKKSANYLDFLFTDSCAQISLTDCYSTEASLGLTFALREWMNYVDFMRFEDVPITDLFAAIQTMEAKADSVIQSTDYAINFYQKDAIAQIDDISVQVVTISVSFIMVIFLLYILLYSPSLSKMLVHTKQALRVHRILRSK